MNFKEFYKFPLKLHVFGDMVFTNDEEMAFDFFDEMLPEKGYVLPKELQQSFIACLNNENVSFIIKNATYMQIKDSIYIIIGEVKLLFIIIRGWSHLTGVNGLNLSAEKAIEIQDQFIEFIISKLTNI